MKIKHYFTSYVVIPTVLTCLASGTLSFFGSSEASLFRREYDVVLDATPIYVKPVTSGVTVDAIEQELETLGEPKAVVLFKINRVILGEFTLLKNGGPSKLEQLQQALQDKNILKAATLNFEDPEKTTVKSWLNIAVADPFKAFGFESRVPENARYRICLKRVPKRSDTYIMVKSQIRK